MRICYSLLVYNCIQVCDARIDLEELVQVEGEGAGNCTAQAVSANRQRVQVLEHTTVVAHHLASTRGQAVRRT